MLIPQFKQSLCVKNHKIIIDKEINENNVLEWYYYINKIIENDKLNTEEKENVEIIISSVGGSIYDGLSLIGQIENLKSLGYKVITTTLGKAFSMAFVLSLCGDERRCYKYSTYMVHDVSSGIWDKLENIREDVAECDRLRNILYNLITEKTKIKIEDLKNWHEHKIDKYFSAEEALALGITDKII